MDQLDTATEHGTYEETWIKRRVHGTLYTVRRVESQEVLQRSARLTKNVRVLWWCRESQRGAGQVTVDGEVVLMERLISLRGFVAGWMVWLCASSVAWMATPASAQRRYRSRYIHQTPSSVKARRAVTIRGRIVYFDDLDYAEVRYRRAETRDNFKTFRMTIQGGEYIGRFPASIVLSPGIEYYVVGINFGGKPRLLAGSPANLLQFLVIDDGSSPRTTPPERRSGGSDGGSDGNSGGDDPYAPKKPGKARKAGGKEILSRKLVVSSATRQGKAVSIHKAPATVTVITAADIRSYGWRTIPDILRSVVGIDINDRGFDADYGMRGVNNLNGRGQGILFMLDGHDMSLRQLHQTFLNASWVSVDDIERIEITRGPSSALWGRNAFHGMVHIVTKNGSGMRGISGLMGVGALSGTHFFQLRAGHKFASGLSIYATLSMHRELRSPVLSPIWEFANGPNELVYVSPNDTQLAQNFYFKADWKGLFFTFHQGRYDATAPLNQYSLLGGDDSHFVMDRWIATTGWQGKLAKWGNLRVWASFDRYTLDPETRVAFNPLAANPQSSTMQNLAFADNRFTLGTRLSANIHKFFQMQVGLQFEYLQATMWHFPAAFEQQIQGKDIETDAPTYGNGRFDGFLQILSPIGKWAVIQAAARFSYDEHAGPRFSPQAGVVITPGADVFIKLNYGMGVRSPSLYELFHNELGRFGNPAVTDEEVHTIGLQVGWMRKKLMYIALSGFFSMYNLPIMYQTRQASDPIIGADLFDYAPDQPTGPYRQLINREQGYTSLGGEIEARLFPIKGFQVRGFFGLAISSEVINEEGDTDRLPYAAGLYGGLDATYRYKFFRISLGLLYTGSKIAPIDTQTYPESRFVVQGQLPKRGLPNEDQAQPVPQWQANNSNHPRAPTVDDIPRADGSLKLHLTLQFLNLFNHFDLVLRAQNILGLGVDAYDAGNPLLAPQKRFELMAWLRFRY